MKKVLCSTTLIFSLSILFTVNSYSQELAKPIPNKAVKKVNTEQNQNLDSKTNTGTTSTKVEENSNSNLNLKTNVDSNANGTNATKDADDYQSKKAEWINQHPEEYKKLSGNPNLVILTQAQYDALSNPEKLKVDANPADYLIIK